jgi:hypothetical protein
VAGCCASGNELSGSIKCGEFLEQLRNCELFKEERVPVSWVVSWLVIQSDGYTVILPPNSCFLTAGLWAHSRISSASVCMDGKLAVEPTDTAMIGMTRASHGGPFQGCGHIGFSAVYFD